MIWTQCNGRKLTRKDIGIIVSNDLKCIATAKEANKVFGMIKRNFSG